MADIELVIKVPEHCLEELKRIELNESNEGVVFHTIKCILNGTPIPKGHGRLIDADAVVDEIDSYIDSMAYSYLYLLREEQSQREHGMVFARDIVCDAPTIIPAEEVE